jgi:ABC-type uncharacterized transport system ATPase subunit
VEAVPTVELRGITKTFPGVIANEDVNLRVMPGEIHAVVGENGAGKSTLMKILYGMQRPDAGTVLVNGSELALRSPKHAIAAGIGMVHQHFMLAEQLSILENVILGSEPRSRLMIDVEEAERRLLELAGSQGIPLDPHRLVEDLSVGEKQRVEILKVLYRGARILILDEPTAVLVPQEVEALFADLRRLTAEGVTIVFISHKLDEVLEIADTVTVMRDGRTVATLTRGEVTARQLAELMVGSELPTPEHGQSTVTDVVELAVRGLGSRSDDGRWLVEEVTFEIHRGEILGIAGVEGNGQRELVETLMGIRSADSGTIELGGEDVTRWTTRRRREAGLGFIPADRQGQGLLLPSPLWENIMLGHQTVAPFARGPWVSRRGARERTREVVQKFDVRTPGIEVAAHALSGGNQQKLITGREMSTEPRVLLAAHPTRGIDVGAQAAVWALLREARAEGLGVLLISADLEELIGLSDKLLVILRGRIVAEVDPQTVTPVDLGSYMTGAAVPA